MKEELAQRLENLKKEYKDGEALKTDLSTKLQTVEQTLLRISGAIQVLEEVLEASNTNENTAPEEPHPDLNMVTAGSTLMQANG